MTAKTTRRTRSSPPTRTGQVSRAGSDLKTGSNAPQQSATITIAVAIGAQVRNLRRKLDLTGAELAEQAGLSAGMLSKIENGAVSASIDSLEALARALNVPLTTFFASYEEQRDCSFVPGGQGVTDRAARHQGRPPVSSCSAIRSQARWWSSPTSSP